MSLWCFGRYSIVCLAAVMAPFGVAQTTIEGAMSGVLTASGPVRVGAVQVASGTTLTIPAGTVLELNEGSEIVVDGGLVIGDDPERPVVFRGATQQPVVTTGAGGSVLSRGVRLDAVEAGAFVVATNAADIELRDVEVAGGRFRMLVGAMGEGLVALERVRVTGGRYDEAVLAAGPARVEAERALFADLDVGAALISAASVRLAFCTVSGIRPDAARPLIAAENVEVTTSVIWPGAPYVGVGRSARVLLAESVVEGGWAQFLDTPTFSRDDGKTVDGIVSDPPVFAADGSYRLVPGTPGADQIPERRAADADGTRADLGAYGGGHRRLGLFVGAGVQTSVAGETDVFYPQGTYPERGIGGAVVVTQELPAGLALRARLGVFSTAAPHRTPGSPVGSDDFSVTSAGLAVLYQVNIAGPLYGGFGPQLTAGRWRYAYGPEAISYHEAVGETVEEDAGPLWKADLSAEIGVRTPFGVDAQAGVDFPLVPRSRWGTLADVTLRGPSGPVVERHLVPLPRVHVGVVVRVR